MQEGQDTSPAQPTDGAPLSEKPGVPESETPATPAHEEAQAASGQPQEDTWDDAPDADEPGDDETPEELQQFEQDSPTNQDQVDQEG